MESQKSDFLTWSIFFTMLCLAPVLSHDLRDFRNTRVKRQTFGLTFYSFSVTSCTAGTYVGQVTATDTSGGSITSYSLSSTSGFFLITSSGAISLNTGIASTETFTVNAVSSTGATASVPVTVTVTCSTTTTASSSTGRTAPVFGQSSYSFTMTCSATQRTRPVGLLWASNARHDTLNYTILNGSGVLSPFFMDTNSGELKTIIPVSTAGTYSLTVQASDPWGTSVTVPVTITVTGIC